MIVAVVLAAWQPAVAAPPKAAHFDGTGRLALLTLAGEPVALSGEIRVAGPDWSFYGASNPGSATGVTFVAESSGVSVWTGFIPLANGGSARYVQRVRPLPDGAEVNLTVTALTNLMIDGISYAVQFPVRRFSQARLALWRGTATVAEVAAPADYNFDKEHIFLATSAVDRIAVSANACRIGLTLDRPRSASFQDDRKWGMDAYTLLIPFGRGPLMRSGETAHLRFVISLAGGPTIEPVLVDVKPDSLGGQFDGMGGNFVYGLETPVATALVARLAPVRARIEMALYDWEPENDNASPDEMDWARFEARDTPGSDMRRRFELAALLAARKIPLCISVWDLPEWMYEGPPKDRWASRRTVAPGLWPEVLESAAAYLMHLKKRYGVEPELFSFNEPEAGVRVLFTAEQHREMIRRFGERFEALGLKTRILLADVASPRDTVSYGVFALSDPACLRYIGAVAFHSWGGATPREYAAWQALARRFGLPLDITELGWDPGVWHKPHELRTPYYAVQELKLIMEAMAGAQPRSALLWEYSDDYPLLTVVREQDGRLILEDTPRLLFLEQLVNRTPRPARWLEAVSSRADVPVAAFASEKAGGKPAFVLHLANTGAARKAVISGLPVTLERLQTTILTAMDPVAEEGRIPAKNGQAELELPAWSLVSLSATEP